MKHAEYSIISNSAPEYVLIRDLGPWDTYPTVTNDAEWVVEELFRGEALKSSQRLLYYDSEGVLGELKHDGKKFTGFAGADKALLCSRCGGAGEVVMPDASGARTHWMAPCPRCKPPSSRPSNLYLSAVRTWARDCAHDSGTAPSWRPDFEALAEACERLMRRYEHATVREEPPA